MSPKPMKLPPGHEKLREQMDVLRAHQWRLDAEWRQMLDEARDAAGWTKCCSCYPKRVGFDGFCQCCRFDQITGKRDTTPPCEVECHQ